MKTTERIKMKCTFAGPPIMKDKIWTIIIKMELGKATGSDSISVELLQMLDDYGIDMIASLI